MFRGNELFLRSELLSSAAQGILLEEPIQCWYSFKELVITPAAAKYGRCATIHFVVDAVRNRTVISRKQCATDASDKKSLKKWETFNAPSTGSGGQHANSSTDPI